MQPQAKLTAAQENLLMELAAKERVSAKGINKRTYGALEEKGLAKVRELKKEGIVLSITAKGRKHLN